MYLYAALFIGLLIYYAKKTKFSLNPGILIIAFYTLIAILGPAAYYQMPKDNFFHIYDFTNVTLLPYLYLFVTSVLFILPIFKFKYYANRPCINVSLKAVRYLCWFYIFCAIISIFLYYRTISNYTIDDLAEIRMNVYQGEMNNAYGNIFEHFFLSFTSHLNQAIVIIFFYLLAYYRNQFKTYFFVLLFIAVTVPIFGDALRTVSRGMIITLFIELALGYSFFSQQYTRKLKRTIVIVVLSLLPILWLYSQTVTEARFGEGDDATSSLICYWGQPPVIFNSQVFGMDKMAYGQRFFYSIAKYMGYDPDRTLAIIGKNFNPCFDTFIGDFYMDFSWLGTIILSILIPYIVTRYFNRNRYNLGHLYLMFFYVLTIQHGALVTKIDMITDVLFVFAIYLFLSKVTSKVVKRKI